MAYTCVRWLITIFMGTLIVVTASANAFIALILATYIIWVTAVSYLSGHEDGEGKGYKEGFHAGKELGFRQGQNSEQTGRIIYGDRWGKDE
jgi:flagellar biosynthesis/type III secretory pathway protein FliH